MNSEKKTGWGASSTAPGLDRLVSKREAAGILGASVRTVERLVSAGSLQIQKVRGCVRLRISHVMRVAGIEQPETSRP